MSGKGTQYFVGNERNAYSRGTHNNRASRLELAQQLRNAGLPPSTRNGAGIAYAGEYANILKGMRNLTLKTTNNLKKQIGKGRPRRRQTRRRR